ncbi:hypothetical protein [Ethanoligenens harbinense]|uniref:Uncharacterized protein n=1 Tax=Ethanoligenens harbinense (strain DSM 18485 / JCM 12961 / CGMCC 1.5033 / YUAN-3) TaxID=663278 RepID=E6U8W5_ETHHY|nr:hypothetical protein [Ethanoligenens harbinense]ADU27200.1 hypothetical protein Ethha_1666 [Ethanoligenens harbinense YUAN-3]AVQ96268.1 hypothetical protein CXQ68_08550 [Ethanoligenens harbinense YUAN-3]AYF38927.1 hypothetical protein CXP51_08420 [Ethanoligenens harbinense]AYF41679.1 hypothetical protein CN246_08570 [Ethanoligenens harbinense]QCN92510.1 hypothetical protein DRA42_08580 [Ethanoligenens harbinense]
MSTKNVYFYKVSLFESNPNVEHPIDQLKALFDEIFNANVRNSAIALSHDDIEPIIMDIINIIVSIYLLDFQKNALTIHYKKEIMVPLQ